MKDLRIHSRTKAYAYSDVFRNNNDNACLLISREHLFLSAVV